MKYEATIAWHNGTHITVDPGSNDVHLHYDAYDPTQGLGQTIEHWWYEVEGPAQDPATYINANPMWPNPKWPVHP